MAPRLVAVNRIPDFYLPPLGLPVYWMDEQSGKLANALGGFYAAVLGEIPECPQSYASLVIAYLQYVINAPCWEYVEGNREAIARLREQASVMENVEDIQRFITGCLQIGIDPL